MRLSSRSSRWATWSAAALSAAAALLLAWRWLAAAWGQWNVPWDLAWETPSLGCVVTIQRHANLYSADTYNAPPFVLPAYTPLYYYLVSLFPVDRGNPFFYGRLVSLVGFLALAGLIAWRGRSHWRRPVGWFLAVAFLSAWPVTTSAAAARNDSLGMLLAVAGMFVAAGSKTWRGFAFAALLSVAALAAKQSFLAATAATALFLLANSRRALLQYVLALLAWGIFAAAAASVYFGGGFWFCVLQTPRQPLDVYAGAKLLQVSFSQQLLDVLGLTALAVVAWRIRSDGWRRTLQASPLPAFFLLATLQLLATCWKAGAGANYLFEPVLAACLLLADGAGKLDLRRPWPKLATIAACCLGLAGLADFACAPPTDYTNPGYFDRVTWASRTQNYRHFIELSGLEKPRVLDTATHLALTETGQPDFNDPWLYRMLWDGRILSPAPLLAAIEREQYDVIVTPLVAEEDQPPRGRYPDPKFLVTGFRGPLSSFDQRVRGVLAGKYRLYASSPGLRCCFFVRTRE